MDVPSDVNATSKGLGGPPPSEERTLPSAMRQAGSAILRGVGSAASDLAVAGGMVASAIGLTMAKAGVALFSATFLPGIVHDAYLDSKRDLSVVVPGSAPRPPGAMPRSAGEVQQLFQNPQSLGDVSLIGGFVAAAGVALAGAGLSLSIGIATERAREARERAQ